MPTCFRHHLCCPPSVSVHHGRHNFATSVCHQCALCSNAATSHSAAHAATTSSASWTPTKTVTSPTWSSSSRPTTRPTRSSSTGRTRTATAASRASVVFICSVLLSVRPSTAVVAAAVVSSQYGGVVVSFGVVRVRTHAHICMYLCFLFNLVLHTLVYVCASPKNPCGERCVPLCGTHAHTHRLQCNAGAHARAR